MTDPPERSVRWFRGMVWNLEGIRGRVWSLSLSCERVQLETLMLLLYTRLLVISDPAAFFLFPFCRLPSKKATPPYSRPVPFFFYQLVLGIGGLCRPGFDYTGRSLR